MIAVDTNINCGSVFSFPTPAKWRKHNGSDVNFYSGKVSILLGGDNFPCHPLVIEEDKWGVSLLKSRLSDRFIIFGPVNLSSITWSVVTVRECDHNAMSVSVVDFQEQILMKILAQKYSDPSNREKSDSGYQGIRDQGDPCQHHS